jgi:hypothetical protein
MRPRIASLLAVVVAAGLATQALADDGDSQPSRGIFPGLRSRSKAQPAKPANNTTTQVVASDAVLAPPPADAQATPPATTAAPAAAAPTTTGTPWMNVSEPDGGCALVQPHSYRANGQVPVRNREVPCLGCSTCLYNWRFFLGGCRSFWGEGRHEIDYPAGCSCSKR